MQRIVHRDTAVDIDGNGFCAIGRLSLLTLLQRECASAGVTLAFGTTVDSLERIAGYELIVAADGVNSRLRSLRAHAFAPRTEWLTNKFVWYGTGKAFECLTLTFRESEHGAFVAHHYRYAPDRSTFIVECDAATWKRAGLGDDGRCGVACVLRDRVRARSRRARARVEPLDLAQFPAPRRTRGGARGTWCSSAMRLRTGHFSIGSGTRLAFDDAIALDRALGEAGDDVPALLAAFERERRPVVDKLVAAANSSSYWYERMADKMALDPVELAYDYMTRSGRMDDARLREMAPRLHARRRGGASVRRDTASSIPSRATRRARKRSGSRCPSATTRRRCCTTTSHANRTRSRSCAASAGSRTRRWPRSPTRRAPACAGWASRAGGRVLMLLDDTPEYVAAIFGALRAGFVPVLVNTLSPPELVAYYLSDSGAEAAFVDARFASLLSHGDVSATRLRQVVHVGDLAEDALPQQRMRHEWNDWIAAQRDVLEPADTHRDDMAFWMYSSGSTGRPKGVVHLHHDALYTWQSYGQRVLGLRADDVVFSPPKIFFAYGFGNSITFPFAAGATTVLMPGRPEPEAVFATIERHRPTVLFGLPTLYVAMAALAGSESRDLSSLRLCLSAAETLSSELFNEWQRRYGLAIVEGLGSTEVLHIYLSNSPSQQKPGASGKRVPGYELRLTDPDGRDVAEGESGILWVRGDSQAPCYWRRPDKTAETMRDGWIYTGDRFRRDADGFHFFEGRADDLVKVSGQWVLPLEVERCLAECPLVRECVVLALEDAQSADDARRIRGAARCVARRRCARPVSCSASSSHGCCLTSTRARSCTCPSCRRPAPARSTGRRSRGAEQSRGKRRLDRLAVLERETVSARARLRHDDFGQVVVDEMQRRAVVSGISRRYASRGEQAMESGPALGLAVVMRACRAGEPSEAAQGRQRARIGIGDAVLEPADHAGADAAHHGPALVRRAQRRVEIPFAPQREHRSRVAAADVDRVLLLQECREVRRGRLEQRQVRGPAIERGHRLVELVAHGFGVAARAADEAHPRIRLVRCAKEVPVEDAALLHEESAAALHDKLSNGPPETALRAVSPQGASALGRPCGAHVPDSVSAGAKISGCAFRQRPCGRGKG